MTVMDPVTVSEVSCPSALDVLIEQGRAVPAANPGPIPPTPRRAPDEESVSLGAALAELRDYERA